MSQCELPPEAGKGKQTDAPPEHPPDATELQDYKFVLFEVTKFVVIFDSNNCKPIYHLLSRFIATSEESAKLLCHTHNSFVIHLV